MFGWFSRFIRKIYAPEIESLKTRLETAEKLRDWYREQFDKESENHSQTTKKLFSEIQSNRKREDALKAGHNPPQRQMLLEPEPEKPSALEIEAKKREDQILYERAIEICDQKYGENQYTEANINEQFKLLNLNQQTREYYLSN